MGLLPSRANTGAWLVAFSFVLVLSACDSPPAYTNAKYVGEYANGKANGQGTIFFDDGRKYVGEVRDDKRRGQGTLTFPNGQEYRGSFVDDQQNGQGVHTWPDGQRYVGEFRDGKQTGQGTLTLPTGEEYRGYFVNGKFSGQGTYTWPDGSKYVGEFRDSKRNGQGTQEAANSQVYSGMWANDQFVGTVTGTSETSGAINSNEVPLVKEAGTFRVPVTINGSLILNFTVDSGASDVSIPADVVMTLMRTGTLTSEDFLGTQIYRMADGSTVPSTTFRIRSLKVGGKVIQNVTGSMSNVEGSLLLGQSFLSRLGRVSFDYNRGVLVLE